MHPLALVFSWGRQAKPAARLPQAHVVLLGEEARRRNAPFFLSRRHLAAAAEEIWSDVLISSEHKRHWGSNGVVSPIYMPQLSPIGYPDPADVGECGVLGAKSSTTRVA